jgi:hypothetical protein
MVATLIAAGLCGLLFVWLSLRVVMVRQSAKVLIGDGGDALLLSRIRAHANFAEYVPIILLLMLAIELSLKTTPRALMLVAFALPTVRLAHALGMGMTGTNLPRAIGILGTWALLAGLSGWALVVALRY